MTSRFEAATRRTSTRRTAPPPDALHLAELDARRSFACSSGEASQISSRKSVPPSDALEDAGRSASAPVNAPLDVAEELALDQRLRHRGAVQALERPLLARAVHGQEPCDQLLAGAALPRHEDGRSESVNWSILRFTSCITALCETISP
jgi:hypothetical protein